MSIPSYPCPQLSTILPRSVCSCLVIRGEAPSSDRIKTLELIHRQREERRVRSDRVIQAATGCHQLPPLHRSGCQKGEGGINFPRQLAPASTLNINTLFLQLAVPITTHYYALELETKENKRKFRITE